MDSRQHKKRILNELRAAGMTTYGTMKMETEHLPNVIHENEHIGGVVYGRTTGEKVGSAMLIATDKRIIFLDVKPFFKTFDEVSYDVVAGVKKTKAGPFAGVILHTRVRDYGLRFTNSNCAENFVEYIENHIELQESLGNNKVTNEVWKSTEREKNLTNVPQNSDAAGVIKEQNVAILSTVDREGNAHGAVVHYVYEGEQFYIVTKKQTEKAQNIAYHGQVALTIHKPNSLKTVQVSGLADTETSQSMITKIYRAVAEPKNYEEGSHFPPVVSMKKGEVTVIKVSPMNIRYHDYSKSSW
ncbi:pyridoxamine 5'-phosphate oxidase family protein [Candidatus Saccharibacteria bacterium]|nr:pyridoxamine 5'-phosphate oxidase family protein [Candidatus Saccharibacteria bacterium]